MAREVCGLCLCEREDTLRLWYSVDAALCKECRHEVVRRYDVAHPGIPFWAPDYLGKVREWLRAELARVAAGGEAYFLPPTLTPEPEPENAWGLAPTRLGRKAKSSGQAVLF